MKKLKPMLQSKTLKSLEQKFLNRVGKAIHDYSMIKTGDRVLVCLSGGKDSHTMLDILNKLKLRSNDKFYIQAFVLDQMQPGWDDTALRAYLTDKNIPFEILSKNTYKIVLDKIPENKTYCSLCSRLRRGNIYNYAKEHNFNKIALGHHRDDLLQSLLMSIFYNGEIKSMPPKLLTDSKEHIVIRPLVYCSEDDISAYARLKQFPIIPCNLCGSQDNLKRKQIKALIKDLALDNPKVPSNMLHALQKVAPSQLMDKNLFNFLALEQDYQFSTK